MAIPNILVCKGKQGNGAVISADDGAVYELVAGGELKQIGDTLTGGLGLETPDDASHARAAYNRVIEFRGELYWYFRNTVRRLGEGGAGLWGVVHTLANQNTNENYAEHTGLFKVQANGTNYIVGLYQNAASQMSAFKFDGTTWTDIDPINVSGDSGGQLGRAVVFRNKVYSWVDYASGDVICYDPVSDTGTLIEVPATASAPAWDFAVHQNQLYLAGTVGGGASANTVLCQLQGNSFSTIHTFTEVQNVSNNETSCPVLFSDGTDLIAIIPGRDVDGTGTAGDVGLRIQNPGTGSQIVTNVSATLLPNFYRGGGEQASEVQHWHKFVNTDTDPLNPEIYLFRANTLDGGATQVSYACWQYTNTATELTYINNGMSLFIMPAYTGGGGSEYISGGTNKVYAELEGLTEVTGGVQFGFRVFGTGSDKTATLYVSSGESFSLTLATLTGTATGGTAVRSGNTITSVTPDDGSTLYTCVWAAGTDGFSQTDHVNLQLNLV